MYSIVQHTDLNLWYPWDACEAILPLQVCGLATHFGPHPRPPHKYEISYIHTLEKVKLQPLLRLNDVILIMILRNAHALALGFDFQLNLF